MGKYAQGKYTIKNSEKYIGKSAPTFRSSWEFTFCTFCDNNPAILNWASEPLKIPYFNPVSGKNTIYVPDFLIVYVDSNKAKHTEVIEIKPMKETTMETARSVRDKYMVAVNMAKWAAAQNFCKIHGMRFRIVTERDIYSNIKR